MATMVTMPRLSPTMEEGVLAKWTKKEGDKISPGDVIAEVETDKANMDFPLEDEGVLLKLLVSEGQTVKLGEPVAVLGEAGEDPAAALAALKAAPAPAPAPTPTAPPAPVAAPTPVPAPAPVAVPVAVAAPAPVAVPVAVPAPAPARAGDGQIKAPPLARKIADERGVDLRTVTGTGPGGRIVKRDVEGARPGA